MNNEFVAGYKAAYENYDVVGGEFSIDNKSNEFISGYSLYMHEQEELCGNPDVDSYDY